MPAPTDAVLPILRRIQETVAETRRGLGQLGRKIDHHSEKLDSIENYLIYELGLSSRDRANIRALQAKMKSMEKRVTALERSPRGNGRKRKS